MYKLTQSGAETKTIIPSDTKYERKTGDLGWNNKSLDTLPNEKYIEQLYKLDLIKVKNCGFWHCVFWKFVF